MTCNEVDAEDLLQNSFIDVFSKLDSFRFQSSIGAWIKRITINNCINFLKKRKLHFEELTDHTKRIEESDAEVEVPNNRLDVKSVRHAVYKLPEGYRVVFSLYAMEGYDHKEIAQILEISEATSKSQYSRAKKRLKDLLTSQNLQREVM